MSNPNLYYRLIRRPVVTEKSSTLQQLNNQFTFEVVPEANKSEVKKAVETLFKVKVTAVNTLRQEGKKKIFRGRRGQRSDYKKAMVTLAEGHTIDVTTGV